MTATAVLPRSGAGRPAAAVRPAPTRAVAYQRILHTLVRRELRLLAELSTWAPAAEPARTAALTRHAELIGRVLLQHHRVERDLLWPALQRALPGDEELATRLADWTASCARIDHKLRDLATAARQWAVAETCAARDSFAMACLDLADAVDAQTAREEEQLHPLLAAHLETCTWTAIARSVRSDLSPREQTLVLGLALEDACAGDRARLLSGLPALRRWAWRAVGSGRYRAAVVRLRGAPPAL
ncbi:hemerythrin domain-containing protein [Geodermatophilus sp. URMC 64]